MSQLRVVLISCEPSLHLACQKREREVEREGEGGSVRVPKGCSDVRAPGTSPPPLISTWHHLPSRVRVMDQLRVRVGIWALRAQIGGTVAQEADDPLQ